MNIKDFFANLPTMVKYLLITNVAVLAFGFLLETVTQIDLSREIGLYYFKSEAFRPYQIFTHMFMHGGFMHLLFNMYALWMFGQVIERVWGAKRFLIYYMVTGLGAAALHTLVNHFEIQNLMSELSQEEIGLVMKDGLNAITQGKNFIDPQLAKLNLALNIPVVGASGAVFGLLLAFGMLFPNAELMMFFVPFPIKAKYFVIGYGLIELFSGIADRPGDNIAHYAHLGGMIFGFILIKLWGKGTNQNVRFM